MTDEKRTDCIKFRAESNDTSPCQFCSDRPTCVELAFKEIYDRLQKGNDKND